MSNRATAELKPSTRAMPDVGQTPAAREPVRLCTNRSPCGSFLCEREGGHGGVHATRAGEVWTDPPLATASPQAPAAPKESSALFGAFLGTMVWLTGLGGIAALETWGFAALLFIAWALPAMAVVFVIGLVLQLGASAVLGTMAPGVNGFAILVVLAGAGAWIGRRRG